MASASTRSSLVVVARRDRRGLVPASCRAGIAIVLPVARARLLRCRSQAADRGRSTTRVARCALRRGCTAVAPRLDRPRGRARTRRSAALDRQQLRATRSGERVLQPQRRQRSTHRGRRCAGGPRADAGDGRPEQRRACAAARAARSCSRTVGRARRGRRREGREPRNGSSSTRRRARCGRPRVVEGLHPARHLVRPERDLHALRLRRRDGRGALQSDAASTRSRERVAFSGHERLRATVPPDGTSALLVARSQPADGRCVARFASRRRRSPAERPNRPLGLHFNSFTYRP